jgi:hypothetical protein
LSVASCTSTTPGGNGGGPKAQPLDRAANAPANTAPATELKGLVITDQLGNNQILYSPGRPKNAAGAGENITLQSVAE